MYNRMMEWTDLSTAEYAGEIISEVTKVYLVDKTLVSGKSWANLIERRIVPEWLYDDTGKSYCNENTRIR